MKRIAVVGTSGSGKTTVAQEVSRRLGVPHIELDSLYWRPGWIEAPEEEFKQQVLEATKDDDWVVCGNYRLAREVLWGRVDTVVWLDMPFMTVFLRTLWRTIRRIATREELWGTNREGLSALFGKYSMPLFVIRTYPRRKREYPEMLSREEYSHIELVHLRTGSEVEEWLGSLGDEPDLE